MRHPSKWGLLINLDWKKLIRANTLILPQRWWQRKEFFFYLNPRSASLCVRMSRTRLSFAPGTPLPRSRSGCLPRLPTASRASLSSMMTLTMISLPVQAIPAASLTSSNLQNFKKSILHLKKKHRNFSKFFLTFDCNHYIIFGFETFFLEWRLDTLYFFFKMSLWNSFKLFLSFFTVRPT